MVKDKYVSISKIYNNLRIIGFEKADLKSFIRLAETPLLTKLKIITSKEDSEPADSANDSDYLIELTDYFALHCELLKDSTLYELLEITDNSNLLKQRKVFLSEIERRNLTEQSKRRIQQVSGR